MTESEYVQEILQSQTADKPLSHTKNMRTPGRQTKQSNQLYLPIEMIAKIEWTQRNAQQNIEQLQNPTM